MRLTFQHETGPVVLHVEPDGDGWRVRLPDGSEHRLTARRLPGDLIQVTEHLIPDADNRQPTTDDLAPDTQHPTPNAAYRVFRVPFARTERGIEFSYAGQTFVFLPEDAARRARGRSGRVSGALTAPMVGVIADVLVQEGQRVEAYQPLVVVEAMKVMSTVEAPFAGTVARVYVQKDQRVAHGAPVVDIAPASEEPQTANSPVT